MNFSEQHYPTTCINQSENLTQSLFSLLLNLYARLPPEKKIMKADLPVLDQESVKSVSILTPCILNSFEVMMNLE